MKMTQHGYETGFGKLLYFVFTAAQLLTLAGIMYCANEYFFNATGDPGSAALLGFLILALLIVVTIIKIATMAIIGAASVAFEKHIE